MKEGNPNGADELDLLGRGESGRVDLGDGDREDWRVDLGDGDREDWRVDLGDGDRVDRRGEGLR